MSNVGTSYITVTLAQSYDEMVVIATPQYSNSVRPLVTRVRNAEGDSFQVRLQNPSEQSLEPETVHYLVIEAGSYVLPDGRAIEAHRVNSTVTDHDTSWQGQELGYLQSYINPVVLGQVMSENDADWSVFWDRGASSSEPPDGDDLWVGKMVGEDSDTSRATEVLGVVVIEEGAGSLEGVAYRAAVGPCTVRGIDNSPPFAYNFSPAFTSAPQVGLVTQAAMDGTNGGWAVLYGAAPLSASSVDLVIDEDQIADSERSHTYEQVAYLVFEEPLVYSCTVVADFEGSPLSGTVPLTVTFTNYSTGASSYLWDFGDGATSTITHPTHVYTMAGVFTVTLQASDGVVTQTCQRPNYISVIPALGDLRMEVGTVSDVGTSYVTVTLDQSYDEMVVIATAQYGTSSQPLLTRVRNAQGDSFQVKLQNPSNESLLPKTVHYLVIEAGRYVLPDGRALEARRMNSTLTDYKNSWQGQELDYWQSYTNPVVLGQVMSENDADWSVFWDRGATSEDPPDGDDLWVGKMVGEDSDTTRETELLGVVVIESGAGSLEDVAYRAAVGTDTVQGVGDSPPYAYNFSPAFGSTPQVGLVSQAGMDGNDGGWAALYGPTALTAQQIKLAIDEDQIGDSERSHTHEQVAYLVFEEPLIFPPPVFADFEAAPRQGPAALTVQFTDTSDLSVDAWRWEFGTGEISTTQHPIYTYETAGAFTVTLRVTDTDTGRWDELVRPAYITVTPVASFTAVPREGSDPLTVQFTDTSTVGVDVWHWDFGTGDTSGQKNPLYAYQAAGLYTVTLRVTDTDTGAWDELVWPAYVLVSPVASFTAVPTAGPAPLEVQFTDTASDGVDQWFWAFGTGDITATRHPLYVYTSTGLYTVSLWVTDTDTGEWDALTKTEYISVSSPEHTRVVVYTYDPLHRLVEADYSTGETFEYLYDCMGNRRAMTETTLTSTVVTTYTYDAANRLEKARSDDDGITWHYTFDDRGNLLRQTPGGTAPAEGETRYTYDAAGRLVEVELYTAGDYATLATAGYDGDGERVRLTTWAGEGITVTYVVHGGRLLISDDGTESTLYLYGRGLIAEHGGEWAFHLRDGVGSVRQVVDEGGTVALARAYRPFGGVLEEKGTYETIFGYLGAQLDHVSGLLYDGGRYYDPTTGRFLTPDRRFDPHDPRTLNPYVPLQDPGLWLLGPMVVFLAAAKGRKKKGKARWWLILLLVVGLGSSVALTACGPGGTPTPQPTGTPVPPDTPPTKPSTPTGPTQTVGEPTPTAYNTPVGPKGPCSPTATPPEPTPAPECDWPEPEDLREESGRQGIVDRLQDCILKRVCLEPSQDVNAIVYRPQNQAPSDMGQEEYRGKSHNYGPYDSTISIFARAFVDAIDTGHVGDVAGVMCEEMIHSRQEYCVEEEGWHANGQPSFHEPAKDWWDDEGLFYTYAFEARAKEAVLRWEGDLDFSPGGEKGSYVKRQKGAKDAFEGHSLSFGIRYNDPQMNELMSRVLRGTK